MEEMHSPSMKRGKIMLPLTIFFLYNFFTEDCFASSCQRIQEVDKMDKWRATKSPTEHFIILEPPNLEKLFFCNY